MKCIIHYFFNLLFYHNRGDLVVDITMVLMELMHINIPVEVAIIMTPMVEMYVMVRTIALDIAVKPMMMLA